MRFDTRFWCHSTYLSTVEVELTGLNLSPSGTALIYSSPYLSVPLRSIFVFKESYLIIPYLC